MDSRRKPLYHMSRSLSSFKISETVVSSEPKQNISKLPKTVSNFLDRNYHKVVSKQKDESSHNSKLAQSASSFIPQINKNSSKIARNRSEDPNNTASIFTTLYKDAEHLNQKRILQLKEKLSQQRSKDIPEAQFQPNLNSSHTKIIVPKYVDPKSYLKLDGSRSYAQLGIYRKEYLDNKNKHDEEEVLKDLDLSNVDVSEDVKVGS